MSAIPDGTPPRVFFFHMHGCPFCADVVGAGGLASRVAARSGAPVYEFDSDHKMCRALKIESFPSIAFLRSDGSYYLWARGAPREEEALVDAVRWLRA